jgi:glycosyltransferase involved in cell wall biosynthesis
MTGTPLVSILSPSMNQARWLRANLESVRRQTYSPIEHVVADGGSTDGTVEVLRSWPGSVSWISESDQGQSEAINKAFGRSSGEIIGWLNSDDAYFSRHSVELAVEAFRGHPEAAVVYGHSALVDGDDRLLHFNWAPPFSRRLLKRHNFIVQPAAFIRRSLLGDALVDDRFGYAMDRELWLRLTEQHEAVRVPAVLAVDRHHPDRKSYTRLDLYERDLALLVTRYGVPELRSGYLRRKALNVAIRLVGASLALDRSQRRDPVIPIAETTTASLLLRQVLIPRRAM